MFIKHGLISLGLAILLTLANENVQASQSDGNNVATGSPIVITGIDGDLIKNVVAHLEVVNDEVPFSTLGFPRSNEYILSKTRSALHALGYYDPKIRLSGDHRRWTLEINPGTPIKWIAVEMTLSGDESVPVVLQNLIDEGPIKVGAVVNHGLYETFKSTLESTARQLGYLDVAFTAKEFFILEHSRGATLKWHINLGPRYRVDRISFANTRLSDKFLQNYLKISEGDYYDFDLLLATQQQLNRSGHFASIYIDREVHTATRTVSIIFNCTPQKKYQFKSSVGFGTDTGGRLGVEWQDRRVNARGHSYSIKSDLSNVSRGASFNYRIPLTSPGSEWINRASYHVQDLDVATSRISTIESRLINKLDNHWTSQYTLLMATEEVSKNLFIESYLKYLIPMWQVDYYSTDDPFRAETGWHWQSIVRLSDKNLSSPDLNFQQTEQQFKWLYSLNSDWRLMGRTKLGTTFMSEQSFLKNMPINYRFFAGGDTSIRGYDYQSLAPADASGELLGGKHLITQTLELDYRYSDSWRWALFVDGGNSFNDFSAFEVKRSVGTGVRWITPVGSIRLDVARGLDTPKDWRIHITIGPDL